MNHFLKILFISFVFPNVVTAQQQGLQGRITGETDHTGSEPLPGVNVYWQNNHSGSVTDVEGKFSLSWPDSFPVKLIVSFTGYQPDSILFNSADKSPLEVKLKKSITLKEVNIDAKREATTISTIQPINTLIVNKEELHKAACCNLSESFETNAAVDVSYSDAVSGFKQIQMLGLDGIYTQVQSENIPLIHGLSSAYGLSFVPGPWVESVLITKGAGSVVNGYSSMTGQINVELIEPEKADKVFVNGYISDEGRTEGNIQFAQKVSEHLSSLLLLHASTLQNKIDHNHDGFLDSPLNTQWNALNRWHLEVPGKLEGQLILKAIVDDREGGQTGFNYDKDYGTKNAYGVGINNKLFEVSTKTGFLSKTKPFRSLGIITSSRYHLLDSYFGLRSYKGEQKSFYANAIYQSIIKDSRHTIKFGSSIAIDHYTEDYSDANVSEVEMIKKNYVPGLFSEYTFNNLEKISLVAGVRTDHHNQFGWFVTPRVHFKYNVDALNTFRLSAGRGWREANILAENTSVFSNSRYLNLPGTLRPEESWNYGGSFLHKFRFLKKQGSVSIDFYRTDFINQVIVDLESIHYIQFYNLTGKSYSNAAQVELSYELIENLDIRAAYKRYSVKIDYIEGKLDKPFVPKDRVLLNLAYKTKNEKWKMDFTSKWFGESRIASGGISHHGYVIDETAPSYFNLMGQVTRVFKKFEIYIGGENLTDYTQHHPIIAADDPFGSSFDASLVWGPLMGRVFYGGFRYSLK